ncbi:MAG: nucleoside triphosphate pyrophosphohydrolase [Christensenellaceae bacterium]|nr:nucleoside triphosphate pyrophosphohydrolase [Christensenellaceae bacterium]
MKRITIIPLATPETMTTEVRSAIAECTMLYFQTEKHPCAAPAVLLRQESKALPYQTMDDLYDECEDFDQLNERIASRLTSDEKTDDIGYAVLGRGVSPELMREIRKKASVRGFGIRVLASQGFAESALAYAVSCGIIEGSTEYNVRSARSLTHADTSVPLAIEEIDTLLRAGEVKLTLSDYYPDEHDVLLFTLNGSAHYDSDCVRRLPLYKLDYPENAYRFDAATVMIVPPCGLMERSRHGLSGLMEVMHRLRAPGGCPWDAEQTHESLRSSLIEEAYEVLDAIDRKDTIALEEELGDLLLQIVFHAAIEQERSEFTMRDVTTGIVNKLIYRHPHVFGSVKVNGADDVLYNWENLKQKEKSQSTVADAMHAVPASFPSLIRSYKIQKKAAHVGFDWGSALEALPKVEEEAAEVRDAIISGDAAAINEEIGDLLFACVNVSRLMKVDPELALKSATEKFMSRFIRMEQLMLSEGRKIGSMSLSEMDLYWERIKKEL